MKTALPIILAGLWAAASGVSPAQSEEPPELELSAQDPLLQVLRERFPETFRKNPTRVVLSIQPEEEESEPTRQVPAWVAKYPEVPSLDFGPYKGEKGKTGDGVLTATRQGDNTLPAIKIVTLAPGHEGTTVMGQPSLWWFQSEQSRLAEVSFILTDISNRPAKQLLNVPLKAMPKGYNSFNLANPALNAENVILRTGRLYQWTIAVRGSDSGSAVFNRIRRVDDPSLEQQVTTRPANPGTLKALSDASNWYELFDTVSRLARYFPENQDALNARTRLLAEAGILSDIPH